MAKQAKEDEPPKKESFSERCDEIWDHCCDTVEAQGKFGAFVSGLMRRLIVDAPVILGFATACVSLFVLDVFIPGRVQMFLGCPQKFYPFRPLAWVRLFTHVFGHSSFQHIKGNMSYLMLVGPSAEKVFGSENMIIILLLVAVSSGFAHVLAGTRNSVQLGASGVVFAMILLNSLVSATTGTIPLSFVITAAMWIGEEVFKLFFGRDGVSHHAHLTGAIVGTIAGYQVHKRQAKKRAGKIAADWLELSRQKKGGGKGGLSVPFARKKTK